MLYSHREQQQQQCSQPSHNQQAISGQSEQSKTYKEEEEVFNIELFNNPPKVRRLPLFIIPYSTYPIHLQQLHNDLPLAPHHGCPPKELFSHYQNVEIKENISETDIDACAAHSSSSSSNDEFDNKPSRIILENRNKDCFPKNLASFLVITPHTITSFTNLNDVNKCNTLKEIRTGVGDWHCIADRKPVPCLECQKSK
ncbi:hypothetical protein LSTR_LSTR014250 [Laodelphax striatellus]|uniref:Uncharacterized protein n=1 Tax=Laodelphax striatellus TaxID=195883 RepID=A0A482WF39_LAOST|nr:hypothetical protein LSTR_LSTR014250 [Laodelphax striatellus]